MGRCFRHSEILLVTLLVAGCGGGSDPFQCGDLPPPREFTITDYLVTAIRHEEAIESNTFRYGEAVGEAPVIWSRLGIELETEADVYMVDAAGANWSLFPTANACSPVPPQPTQTIESIKVVSDNAYTDDYPAGSDLAAIMNRYRDEYGVYTDDIPDYLAEQPPARRTLNLFFTQAPQYERHTFTITIELDDGSRFIVDTPEIYLSAEEDI